MYDSSGKPRVSRHDIIAGLCDIGLKDGDLVQVHSSLSAFGYVEGGADTVVDALLEVVGPEGTVMMPTFNHGNVDIFDIEETVSVNGAITEALRNRPEACRSMHPTHPYAAIGYLARELVEGHLSAGTFGHQSPLGKLALWGGKVLLLGVGMNVNTAAHIGERMGNWHCVGERMKRCKIRDELGHVVEARSAQWRDGECLIEWDALERAMRDRGLIDDGQIGEAEIHLMRAAEVVGTAFFLSRTLCVQCCTMPKPVEPTSEIPGE
ncbi:MAG: aminoglycoside N(3)-acetyltransferase [Armatimonadota bacterium]